MSILILNLISELELDLRMIEADISKYTSDITKYTKYINHLTTRFCNPTDTINKYQQKVKDTEDLVQTLKKTRWFIKKELAVLKEGYTCT